MASKTQTALPVGLSIRQAAEAYECAEKTIRRRITDGTLKAYRVGPRLIRVDRDSLLALARPMGGRA